MDFVTWKFLHVVTLFFAVGLAVSGEIVVRLVAGSRDPHAIRVVTARVAGLGNISSVLFVAGAAFGIAAALAGQIDLLRPWLVLAYVSFAAAMAIGITTTDPWLKRLQRAAEASPRDDPSPELVAVIEDRRALIATVALMGMIVLLVFTMVVKPLD